MDYIVFVDYFSDAERKRIDYTIERWRDKADIAREKGIVIRFKDKNIDSFLDDLYSRLDAGKEQVQVFEANTHKPEIKAREEVLRYHSSAGRDVIEKFLGYIMAKINAQYEFRDNGFVRYAASTKKGQAKIEISITDNKAGSETIIKISGYASSAKFLHDRIDEEMKTFLGGF
ncbi:hypothetical protein [Methanoplanus endosymbiosus]|uniref:Uncharacterized protein n=1 Tax=Methanoplanus endosymbiosus TaxID=33865 RepID=A0A9E7PN18_9EURY|nr:hypothetical protein [Methanoplanus endosymbiosus]UUX92875.1 hypothetical protein L6E24_01735 [Methanoplanus endosymbiosus]